MLFTTSALQDKVIIGQQILREYPQLAWENTQYMLVVN